MKILFATDGAKQSNAAIDMFKRLNIEDGDEIRIISVIDLAVPMPIDIYGGYVPDTTEFEKSARENAERVLEETASKVKERLSGRQVSIITEVLFGSPESRIVELADEMKPELVIVGSHGYSGWERLLLGSVSDAVVHHAPCSVLVVRCPSE